MSKFKQPKKFIFVGLNFPSVYCKLGEFCTYFSTISKEITHRMTHFLPCLYPSIAVHYEFGDWVLIYLGHFTVQSTAVLRDVELSGCLYLLHIMQVFAYYNDSELNTLLPVHNQFETIYLSSINHEPSILTMRRDGQKRKIIRKMCI